MMTFDLLITDENTLKFLTVKAIDRVGAVFAAIKEANMPNPTRILQKSQDGAYISFNF